MIDWLTDEVIQLKRDAIESIYDHRMTVYKIESVYNPKTGFDESGEVAVIVDEPCRISTQVTNPNDGLPWEFHKKTNLICAPEHDIPPGSRVEITFYGGHKEMFRATSGVRRYSDHQTILMDVFDEGSGNYA